jgi:hypothetical protein
MSEDEAPDDAQLIERMRARMAGGNLMEDLDAAAAAPGGKWRSQSFVWAEKALFPPPCNGCVTAVVADWCGVVVLCFVLFCFV